MIHSKSQQFSIFPALCLGRPRYQSVRAGQLEVTFADHPWLYVPHKGKFLEATPALTELVRSSATEINTQPYCEAEIETLVSSGLLASSAATELLFAHPQVLEVFLHITNQCNFAGCTGCATKIDTMNQLFAKPMPEDLLAQYLDLIIKTAEKHGMKKIKLKYAGGEPLTPLATKLIEGAQQYLRAKKSDFEKHGSAFPQLDQVVLTNGKTLGRRVELLKKYKLRVNVSLWGDDRGNDAARGGTGNSFKRIQEGIAACDRSGVEVSVTYVLTAQNRYQLPHFLRMCWDKACPEYLGDPHTIAHPRSVHLALHRAQTKDDHLQAIAGGIYQEYVRGLRAGFAEIIAMLDEEIQLPDLARLVDYLNPDYSYPVTCGSGLNYLVAGMGGVAACHESDQVPISNPADLLAQVNTALPSYELKTHQQKHFSSEDQAMELFLQLHGAGGCPHHRLFEGKDCNEPAAIQKEVFAKIAKEYLSIVMLQRLCQSN
jgi:sulfatase maturation enzyme AslB (radical SAM superfamily)